MRSSMTIKNLPRSDRLILLAALMLSLASAEARAATTAKKTQAGKKEMCWVLNQYSCAYGPVDVYITDDAFMWDLKRLGVALVSKAPFKQMVAHNTRNKKFMLMTVEEALNLLAHADHKRHGVFVIDKSAGVKTLGGLKAVKYMYVHAQNKEAERLENLAKVNPKEAEKERKENKNAPSFRNDKEIWCARDIILPAGIAKVFAKDTGVDDIHPMLRHTEIGRGGKRAVLFDCNGSAHKLVDASMFELPAGYTKTTNRVALLMGGEDDEDDAIGGMFGGGFGTKDTSGKSTMKDSPF